MGTETGQDRVIAHSFDRLSVEEAQAMLDTSIRSSTWIERDGGDLWMLVAPQWVWSRLRVTH